MGTLKSARALRTKLLAGQDEGVPEFLSQARSRLSATPTNTGAAPAQQARDNSPAPPGDTGGSDDPPAEALWERQLHELKEVAQLAGAQIRAVDSEHARLDRQAHGARLNQALETKPKRGHAMVFGPDEPREQLTVVRDPATGEPTADPGKVQHVIEGHFRPLLQPPAGVKHGKYLPGEVQRNYPWQRCSGALDPFTLETDATSRPGASGWLD